jgi:hypothetical protein
MSTAEIQRFVADLNSDAALRAEAEKSQADKSHAAPLAQAVAFAVSKGYVFTIEEAKQHVKARAAAAGKSLTDAELDAVVGAYSPMNMTTAQYLDFTSGGCTIRSLMCTQRPGGPGRQIF